MHERGICVDLRKIMQHFSVEVKNMIKVWTADLRITKWELYTLQRQGPHTSLRNYTLINPLKPVGGGTQWKYSSFLTLSDIGQRVNSTERSTSSYYQTSKKATNLEHWHDNHGTKKRSRRSKNPSHCRCVHHIHQDTPGRARCQAVAMRCSRLITARAQWRLKYIHIVFKKNHVPNSH
jgi:hypothetical protein